MIARRVELPRQVGVLFTGAMVRQIRADLKLETRRLVQWPFSPDPDEERLDNLGDCETVVATDWQGKQHYVKAPYGKGDVLWIREDFRLPAHMNADPATVLAERHGVDKVAGVLEYLADQANVNIGRRRAGRFMPRWASREELEVIEWPDLERLSAIDDEGAKAEGIVPVRGAGYGLPDWEDRDLQDTPRAAYLELFRRINERAGEDPWVWVYKFRRLKREQS